MPVYYFSKTCFFYFASIPSFFAMQMGTFQTRGSIEGKTARLHIYYLKHVCGTIHLYLYPHEVVLTVLALRIFNIILIIPTPMHL